VDATRPNEPEHDRLRRLIQQARWRLRACAQGGPEWDAAMAAFEEVGAELDRHRAAVGCKVAPERQPLDG
jgi:hypothetical protein